MANIKFTNFARTALAVGVGSGDVTMSVTGGTGALFPALTAGQYFYAVLENAALDREIVKVTARATDTFTVTRGQDSTTARAWVAGDIVSLRFVAAAISDAVVGTLLAVNNLSDVGSAATARANLGALTAGDNIGAATATTPSPGDNSTKVATTAFVQGAATGAAIQGAFKNLVASATGSSANVTVTVDEIVVESAANLYTTLRGVSLTIAGTSVGANALDSGTIAVSTWYSVWVIWNGTTTAGLLSTSATAPTMPSGYTHKARVGWIRTDSSGNKYPLAFKQNGRNVRHIAAPATNVTALPVIATGTATWPTAAGINNFFPSTTAKATFQFIGVNLASGYVYFGPNTTLPLVFMTNSFSSGAPFAQVVDMILESSNVYYGGNNAMSISAYGWEDNL